MSKRRKRNICRGCKNDQGKNEPATVRLDCHHILFQARFWKCGYLRQLREYHYCKVQIPKGSLHKSIHMRVQDVPAPQGASARRVLEVLIALEQNGIISNTDNLERRLKVLISLFEGVEPETVKALRDQLDVVCESLDKPP